VTAKMLQQILRKRNCARRDTIARGRQAEGYFYGTAKKRGGRHKSISMRRTRLVKRSGVVGPRGRKEASMPRSCFS
jgi:hypothetical protein